MNHRTLREAVWAARMRSTTKLVALRLVEHWPRIMPSVSGLATFTGFDERTVKSAIRELEESGIIRVIRSNGRRSEYEFLSASGQAIVIPDLATGDRGSPVIVVPGTGDRGSPVTGDPGSPKADNSEADKKAGGRQRRAALSHFVPSEWQPKDAHREKSKGAPPGHFDRELEKFRMWEFKTPRSDWDRAFHNWLTSANERVGMNGRRPVVEDDGEWA